jgi:hypothetical protein
MSQAASQASKFYEEVAKNQIVWAAMSEGKYLKFNLSDNRVSIPMWSSKSRIERLRKLSPGEFGDLEAVKISWAEFVAKLAPELESEGTLIGVNLSGKDLVGYDRNVAGVINSVQLCSNGIP